uniref:Uncharacterized protein n=1 Tax=Meloidogyne enterolobii TaxID=390850 RepID=A0A6V7UY17_MELEN|nr:unnamed protein product [Meloidogyne enterolobii]
MDFRCPLGTVVFIVALLLEENVVRPQKQKGKITTSLNFHLPIFCQLAEVFSINYFKYTVTFKKTPVYQ